MCVRNNFQNKCQISWRCFSSNYQSMPLYLNCFLLGYILNVDTYWKSVLENFRKILKFHILEDKTGEKMHTFPKGVTAEANSKAVYCWCSMNAWTTQLYTSGWTKTPNWKISIQVSKYLRNRLVLNNPLRYILSRMGYVARFAWME